jgi:uncharacterized membrane protein
MTATNDNKSPKSTISIAQFSRLADIIFALAMAVTVLGFQIPKNAISMNDAEVNKFLIAQLEPLGAYLITFIVVTVYWIDHKQRLKYYQKTDEIHLWLCFVYLMFLFLMPYSNTLTVFLPDKLMVKVWFSLNTFLIGMFSFFD